MSNVVPLFTKAEVMAWAEGMGPRELDLLREKNAWLEKDRDRAVQELANAIDGTSTLLHQTNFSLMTRMEEQASKIAEQAALIEEQAERLAELEKALRATQGVQEVEGADDVAIPPASPYEPLPALSEDEGYACCECHRYCEPSPIKLATTSYDPEVVLPLKPATVHIGRRYISPCCNAELYAKRLPLDVYGDDEDYEPDVSDE